MKQPYLSLTNCAINMTMNILILSATIQPPNNARNLKRLNVEDRKQDYLKAFRFYINALRSHIVDFIIFTDNSDYDLRFLEHAIDPDIQNYVELISYHGLDYSPDKGRGFGEFKLLDYTMNHSRIIQLHGNKSTIWKITGRYQLKNINKLIHSFPSDKLFLCHCRNHPIYWCDTYVLAWTMGFYRNHLAGVYHQLDESSGHASAESYFREHIDSLDSSGIQKRFSHLPQLIGVRGYDNRSYEQEYLKHMVRAVMNKIYPWLWI